MVLAGSADGTIRVWSGGNSAHLHTLKGSAILVRALALGREGTLYSGGRECTQSNVWGSYRGSVEMRV
jgi:WD40 repeat protein